MLNVADESIVCGFDVVIICKYEFVCKSLIRHVLKQEAYFFLFLSYNHHCHSHIPTLVHQIPQPLSARISYAVQRSTPVIIKKWTCPRRAGVARAPADHPPSRLYLRAETRTTVCLSCRGFRQAVCFRLFLLVMFFWLWCWLFDALSTRLLFSTYFVVKSYTFETIFTFLLIGIIQVFLFLLDTPPRKSIFIVLLHSKGIYNANHLSCLNDFFTITL